MYMLSAHHAFRIPFIHTVGARAWASAEPGAWPGHSACGFLSTRKKLALSARKCQWQNTGIIVKHPWSFRLLAKKRTGGGTFNAYFKTLGTRKHVGGGTFNNTNEYTEEELDNLLDEYGEVVFTNPYQGSSSAGPNDDVEGLSFVLALAKVADDVKAADIQILCVKRLVYWTSFFIIATAFSNPQIDAIGKKMRDIAEQQFKKVPTGDVKPNSWTLLDFGEVVVHIFLPQQREFYNLEEFYGNATSIELPFKTQVTRQE